MVELKVALVVAMMAILFFDLLHLNSKLGLRLSDSF